MYEVQHLREAHARNMAGLTQNLRRSRRQLRREQVRLERDFAVATRLLVLDEDYLPPPRQAIVRRGLTLLLALALTLL